MKNKLGEDGVINIEGRLGCEAQLLSVDEPNFFDEIESGIKSTVRTLIANGFVTYSSCQGHHSPLYSLRNVGLVLLETEIDPWRALIAEINIINQFREPITYNVLDYRDGKKALMVIFGSIFQLKETEQKQRCFEEYVSVARSSFYNREFSEIYDFTNALGHINTFN